MRPLSARYELQELRDTDSDMPLAIFAFTGAVTLVYDGSVADLPSVRRALETLSPHNGTDIAAALNAAADFKEGLTTSTLTQLVLISDGKSDRVKAMAAARRCLERQLALSMLLIDPTEEGKAFARDVVRGVGGTYQMVMSRKDLRQGTKDISESFAVGRARAERYLEASGREAQIIEQGVADRERVKFTSAYPGRIDRGHDYLLRVYMHIETQLKEVMTRLEQAGDQFGAYPRRGDAEPNQRVPIGTRIEVMPRINFIGVNPPQQRVTWTGSIEELSFRIHYSGPEQATLPCSGFIDISAGGLLLAQIPVSIQVEAGESRVEQRTAEMISRVFASYSRKDEPIVRACKATYRALGIQLFVDKDDILSGQVWRDVLRRSIADHDLFQLFWSQAAADSDEVANEWGLAKELAPARTIDFIRPLYWTEPMPAPPEALGNLEFARLDLRSLQLPESESEAGTARLASSTSRGARLMASFPIVETVDSGAHWVSWLQERMGEVVPFLEDLLAVRYFPPVTFLVDEHSVRAAREVLTTDSPRQGDDGLEPVLEILQALALAFHVGNLVDSKAGRDQRAASFGVQDGESRADYDHVSQMAEWVFLGPTKEYFAGKDVLGEARRSLRQLLEKIVAGDSEHNAAEMIRQTLEKVSFVERAGLSNVVTAKTLEELESFRSPEKKAAAARLLESDLSRLADQYGAFEFFHRTTQHSLRNHVSFSEYLADFVRHWLEYVEVAESNQPEAVIAVGFAVSRTALEWLQRTFVDIQLRVTATDRGWGNDAHREQFEMPIDDYKRCVEHLSKLLFSTMSAGRRNRVAELVNVAVSTHGIYIPAAASGAQAQLARSLAERGWPMGAALAGQPKVLLCMGAVERFEEKLVEMGRDKDEARDFARRFCLSVLVHEHFHAAVATGLDPAGRAALGPEYPARWETASPLNESLAVWCERHFFRSDPNMLEQIDAYIADGTYPEWPYRGAEVIESFQVAGGTPAVRGWMRHLRDDPEHAQQEFDQRISRS